MSARWMMLTCLVYALPAAAAEDDVSREVEAPPPVPEEKPVPMGYFQLEFGLKAAFFGDPSFDRLGQTNDGQAQSTLGVSQEIALNSHVALALGARWDAAEANSVVRGLE